MAGTTTAASVEDVDRKFDSAGELSGSRGQTSLFASLRNHAMTGLAAALLLSVLEGIDLNVQLTPVFESFFERLTFAAYFSVNLVVGFVAGLLVGVSVHLANWFKSTLQRVLAAGRRQKPWNRLAAGLLVSAGAGGLLYFQPGIFRFTLGAIREGEKIALARILLSAEHLFTYLAITAMFVSCWVIWTVARRSRSMHSSLRLAWLVAISAVISAAYYVDSRVEVQQYEYSLHRALFLLELTLAMALVATLFIAFGDKLKGLVVVRRSSIRMIGCFLGVLLFAALVFTFVNFDKNQNLKTQVFFRTTQTKQYFRLAQWALDFDRDGYSTPLGGGDAGDTRADINPDQTEVLGDGIDNNCIGGDLIQQDRDEWMRVHSALNTAPNPGARRLNVIFIFVDAVRADHLSVYGYHRNTTPNLAKLAERASVFENAFTPSPSTYQAVPKFMQSTLWDAHLETWTELLANSGYETTLFPARRAETLYRRIKDPRMISSARTNNLKESVDAVIVKLSATAPEQPVCAYLYAFEPHAPYRQRPDFHFGPSLADLYDGELAYADHHLGTLFEWLVQSGRIDNTMIVITSDHGESLGERGVYKHNSQLYDEQMRVPLIIHLPGLEPRRIAGYVSTIDLGSTILNAVGVASPQQYAGVSLLPMMRGDAFTHPPVYGEHWQRNDSPFLGPEHNVDPEIRKYMVITQDGFKLIYNRNCYSFELFNLKEDPREQRNLFDRLPGKAAEMKTLLGRFVDVVSVSRPPDADEQRFFRGSQDEEDAR